MSRSKARRPPRRRRLTEPCNRDTEATHPVSRPMPIIPAPTTDIPTILLISQADSPLAGDMDLTDFTRISNNEPKCRVFVPRVPCFVSPD